MTPFSWGHSFAVRLAIATSALIIAACIILSVILVRRDLAAIHHSLVDRARTINELLVRESELSLLSGNAANLRQLAEVALAQRDVTYCRFFDDQGAILAVVGNVPPSAPRAPIDATDGPIEVTPTIWEFQAPVFTSPLRLRGEELAFPDSGGSSQPVAGLRQRIGAVAIGVALGPVFEMRRNAYTTSGVLALLVALFSSVSAMMLARAVTRPLADLASAADTVARGDLSVTVPVHSRDEVASLARSFNAMVSSLADSRDQLESSSQALELRSRRLEILNQQLEEATRLRSEFLAQVSHELRTPLHVIIGYAQMLNEGAAGQITAEQRDLIEGIERYSKLQLDLVTDVLDFSRLASGRVSLHVERFALWSLLADVVRLQQSTLQRNDLSTSLDVSPDIPEMETDRIKLQEVVRNLIDNAFKFTASGRVSVRAQRLPDDRVVIEVADTGKGIPAEHLGSVFDEFRQLGTASTRATHGVGLGLSIVRQLVAALGGTVSVSSVVGEGSTFRVELPSRLPDELHNPKS